ncbi:hypothetical protein SDC9_97620 [bioreactor metagenome]|uniref:Uncharacterized protein n=1 Tax=bioreactor metagenome TaxID=1076179 RepID=A0A645AMM1_9ZZZZ
MLFKEFNIKTPIIEIASFGKTLLSCALNISSFISCSKSSIEFILFSFCSLIPASFSLSFMLSMAKLELLSISLLSLLLLVSFKLSFLISLEDNLHLFSKILEKSSLILVSSDFLGVSIFFTLKLGVISPNATFN